MNTVKNVLTRHFVFVFLLVFYVFISFFTYKSYGITADEELEYKAGRISLHYYTNKFLYNKERVEILNNSKWPEHILPESGKYYRLYPILLNIFNPHGYYEWFHLLNMLAVIPLFIFTYLAIFKLYGKRFPAFFSIIVLLTIPRFAGDFPANPKDIPFAVAFVLSLEIIYLISESKIPQTIKILVLGILFGYTTGLRSLGLMLFPVYFFYLYIYIQKNVLKSLISSFLVFLVSFIFLIITWPFLSSDPFKNFFEIVFSSSKFTSWDNTVFYASQFLTREARPWHYLPVWLLISTPLHILIGFAVSIINIRKLYKNKVFFLVLSSILFSLALYFIINPIIYNGLRHFLFLLPLLAILATLGLYEITATKMKNYLYLPLGLYLVFTLWRVGNLFPFHYLYFNELVGGLSGAHNRYEQDYWGATYKEATEWVKNYQSHNHINGLKVYPCNVSYAVHYYSEGKFQIVNKKSEADLIMCDYDNDLKEKNQGQIIYEVKRENTPLNIIRLNSNQTL